MWVIGVEIGNFAMMPRPSLAEICFWEMRNSMFCFVCERMWARRICESMMLVDGQEYIITVIAV
jgi:hypothetical protein